jgi:hypothetical protein
MSELVQRTNYAIEYVNQEVARDCEAIQRAALCTQEGVKSLSDAYVYIEFKVRTAEEMVKRIEESKTAAGSANAEDEQLHAIMRRRSFLNKADRLMEYVGEETIRRVVQVAARDGTGRWGGLFR